MGEGIRSQELQEFRSCVTRQSADTFVIPFLTVPSFRRFPGCGYPLLQLLTPDSSGLSAPVRLELGN